MMVHRQHFDSCGSWWLGGCDILWFVIFDWKFCGEIILVVVEYVPQGR